MNYSSLNYLNTTLELENTIKYILFNKGHKSEISNMIKYLNIVLSSNNCLVYLQDNVYIQEELRKLVYTYREYIHTYDYYYKHIFNQDKYDPEECKKRFKHLRSKLFLNPKNFDYRLYILVLYSNNNKQLLDENPIYKINLQTLLLNNRCNIVELYDLYYKIFLEEYPYKSEKSISLYDNKNYRRKLIKKKILVLFK